MQALISLMELTPLNGASVSLCGINLEDLHTNPVLCEARTM